MITITLSMRIKAIIPIISCTGFLLYMNMVIRIPQNNIFIKREEQVSDLWNGHRHSRTP